jgi:hypothetical protein
VAGATSFPKVGWPDYPIFGQGGGSNHPQRSVWGGVGGGPATPKCQKKKKKKRKNVFWPLGVAGPPPRAWRWPKPPPTAGRGCPKPPSGPRGWSGHPQRPKHILLFFFLEFWGGRTTPYGLGVASATPYRPLGVVGATPLAKNVVVRPPHFWEGGGSSHPDFLFFFFFFFFFQFPSFFQKKKKKPKMQNYIVLPKTA